MIMKRATKSIAELCDGKLEIHNCFYGYSVRYKHAIRQQGTVFKTVDAAINSVKQGIYPKILDENMDCAPIALTENQ